MAAPALEKLRMHWTSHMDQYDVMSHPQYESPLPYLISSQPRKDPLSLLRSRPQRNPNSLLHTMSTSAVPPGARALPKTLWGQTNPAYGKDPSWRSEQISFLHSEQQRHSGGERSAAGPSMAPLAHMGPSTVPYVPQAYPQGAPYERRPPYRSPSPVAPAVPLRRPARTEERQETKIPKASEATRMDPETVKRYIPPKLQRYFLPCTTKEQPHLALLRERKAELKRRVDAGDAAALAEVHEIRAGKRRTNPNGLLSEQEKKANHIASEQKRRANIRKGYDMLCDTLPALRARKLNGKMDDTSDPEGRAGVSSELTVLDEAIEVLEQRLNEHRELVARKAELQTRILDAYSTPR